MAAVAATQTADSAPPAIITKVRSGRNIELALLVVALVIGLGAYATTGLKLENTLPDGFWTLAIGASVLVLLAHLLIRWRAKYADPVMLPIVVVLNGLGLAMIYRLDRGGQIVHASNATNLAPKQAEWTVISLIAACVLIAFLRDHRILRRFTYTAMIVGLVLIMLPLVPGLGKDINGAKIWVYIGGFSIQPAEFAKIAFAIFFAGYLVTNRDTLTLAGPKILRMQFPRWRDLLPLVLVWLASLAVLVFETDLGTSLLFFGLFVAMIYIATERTSWMVVGGLLFVAGALLAITLVPHVTARFDSWLHAFDNDVYTRTYNGSGQIVQGLFSLAAGGLFGSGWGGGYPRVVPYSYSDFIYTALGETLGLVGLLAILLLYLVLAERGMRAAMSVRDGFGKLLAGGLAFVMAWQLFVVVGGITRIIPLTGLTMPFVAAGGSSLLANWLVLGLLLRISHDARKPSAPTERGQVVAGHVIAADDDDPIPLPGTVPAIPDDNATQIVDPRGLTQGTPAHGTPAQGIPGQGTPAPGTPAQGTGAAPDASGASGTPGGTAVQSATARPASTRSDDTAQPDPFATQAVPPPPWVDPANAPSPWPENEGGQR